MPMITFRYTRSALNMKCSAQREQPAGFTRNPSAINASRRAVMNSNFFQE